MIIGTGIDIVELSRIEAAVQKNERFIERILTEKEQNKFASLTAKRKIEYLAGRFAAKEAFVKAADTSYGWKDIEILNDSNGKPYLNASFNGIIHVSISHSQSYAISHVIIERASS
ncbi:4'-phosphopantetheinyl transferase [Alkalihalobacillus alcalophilus ATCC 27647 = CGMCC 1.3604]|uniref:Holo-[acyl-carrier-protein] synthase n=1 Tax=Alkalihalobacillus alcalophilus ATCC 27647 = CGMCC 1.3604 TaxID=1218173 RepID=A0A094XBQ3_ALKAL|nr:holo-ACP synthase [Alkalihalobacillus alcalophilus]KGA96220.1 4'-phosphopantetheinyl transferase [Alkalihalobacillus alcalophilus ATCC 27647 = CGMCC 1.3604]MED1563000.1 holo-ACP synthase [Alkalihalobacillus alcalophilus]THG92315.1 4'-phosphopantetheinyl transferase [Alkalihalobacillus alcalophilus ATCC 27647 = CGMCC 1.3604]